MHPPVSARQWEAIRALRAQEVPTFTRLAAAANLNPATVRERAVRDNWPKQNYRKKQPVALLPADLPESGENVRPEELRRRFAEVLPRLLGRVITLAERGILDKASIDAVVAIGRALERWEALAEEQARAEQKKSDDELAELLAKADRRIHELAHVYAEQLVSERDRQGQD